MVIETYMSSAVILVITTREQYEYTNPSVDNGGLQYSEVWCILCGSTLDSANLVSHTATVFRMFGFSSRGRAIINNHIFTVCGTRNRVGVLPLCNSPLSKLISAWLGMWKYSFLQKQFVAHFFQTRSLRWRHISCLFLSEMVDTALSCPARITRRFIDKKTAEKREESHI